jgi:hypothetical protein
MFDITTFTPIHVVLSLVGIFAGLIVAAGFVAGAGGWHGVFVVGSVLALYLNVFILLAQLFLRLPALIAAAPTQKEPPFLVTQLVVLTLFLWLGRAVRRGFRAESVA